MKNDNALESFAAFSRTALRAADPGKLICSIYLKPFDRTSRIRLTGCAVILTLLVGNTCASVAVAGTSCQPLLMPVTADLVGLSTYSLDVGQPGLTSTLEFYSFEVGTIDLGAGANLNYSTCIQCLRLLKAAVDDIPSKQFFQDRGLLELSTEPGADPLPVAFSNLRLIEVTIDESFQSTPVPDGECYETGTGAIFINGFEQ